MKRIVSIVMVLLLCMQLGSAYEEIEVIQTSLDIILYLVDQCMGQKTEAVIPYLGKMDHVTVTGDVATISYPDNSGGEAANITLLPLNGVYSIANIVFSNNIIGRIFQSEFILMGYSGVTLAETGDVSYVFTLSEWAAARGTLLKRGHEKGTKEQEQKMDVYLTTVRKHALAAMEVVYYSLGSAMEYVEPSDPNMGVKVYKSDSLWVFYYDLLSTGHCTNIHVMPINQYMEDALIEIGVPLVKTDAGSSASFDLADKEFLSRFKAE